MSSNENILSRAIRVVDAISKNEAGLRFSEISRLLGDPSPSTVNKILKELTGQSVIEKTGAGRYSLGRKIYFWGRVMNAQKTPVDIIRQQMEQLQAKFGVSVNLFTCIEQTMFCLECYMDADSPLLYPAGRSLPLRLSVQGAVFFLSRHKLDDPDFLKSEIKLHGKNLPFDDVRRMIDHALESGVQDDQGMFYPETHRISVPLNEKGKTVMTLGVGISSGIRNESEIADRIMEDLVEIKSRIEAAFE